MPTLLVSGFGPFPGAPENASWDALQLAHPTLPVPWTLKRLRLAVVWDRAAIDLAAAIDADTRVVVAFGQADDDFVRLERFAVNAPDRALPDAAGRYFTDRYIDPDGPAAFESSLPIGELLQAVEIPDTTLIESHHAGSYLCNFTFYRLMQLVTRQRQELTAGFIHVPPSTRLDLAATARAIEGILEQIVIRV